MIISGVFLILRVNRNESFSYGNTRTEKEENDISLYNALHDEPLPTGTTIEKICVDNKLYMNFKNDVSFGIGGKILVFGEHQSTVNENMPLRSLLYLGRACCRTEG